MDGWYEVTEVVCYARAAREQWEREQRKNSNEPEAGVLALVEDTRPDA